MWLQRITLLWILFLGAAGCALGWYLYTVLTVPYDETLRLQVYAVPSQFRSQIKPNAFLRVEQLLGQRPKSLNRYASLLPGLHRSPYPHSKAFIHFKETCRSNSLPKGLQPNLKKAWLWESFLCGQTKQLKPDFFSTPPYIHPLGQSYAYRARKSKRSRFQTSRWLRKNWRWMHILELSNFSEQELGLSKEWKMLRRLHWQVLEGIQKGRSLILATSLVLIKEVSKEPASPGIYRVFARSDFTRFLRSKHLSLQTKATSQDCPIQQGRLCWRAWGRAPSWWGVTLGLTLFALCIGLLIHLVLFEVRKYLERQRLQERHTFLVQTLTHELRTPTTVLQLAVDTFRRDYDEMPETSQTAFLRMCQELQKLKRVIHASQQYLQSNLEEHALTLQRTTVPSLSQLVTNLVAEWEEEHETTVTLEALSQDCAIQLDPYWFKVCFLNLLSNAQQHGKPPISVSFGCEKSCIRIAVQDQGSATLKLEELLQPFYKNTESTGLGLGLGIVNHLVREMGGSLSLTSNPTTFMLTLERSL